jgi:hypothetical protein
MLAVTMRAMETGVRWAFVGITHLIGDRGTAFWVVFRNLIEDVPDMVVLILRVCLLAAFFDTILQRIRRRQQAVEDDDPKPAAPQPDAPQPTPAGVR